MLVPIYCTEGKACHNVFHSFYSPVLSNARTAKGFYTDGLGIPIYCNQHIYSSVPKAICRNGIERNVPRID